MPTPLPSAERSAAPEHLFDDRGIARSRLSCSLIFLAAVACGPGQATGSGEDNDQFEAPQCHFTAQPPVQILELNDYSMSVFVSDLNTDGHSDLITHTYGFHKDITQVFMGNGQGGFEEAEYPLEDPGVNVPFGSNDSPFYNRLLGVADFDGDGKPDDFMYVQDTGVNLFVVTREEGKYNGPFPIGDEYFLSSPVVVDLNSDGCADLLAENFNYVMSYRSILPMTADCDGGEPGFSAAKEVALVETPPALRHLQTAWINEDDIPDLVKVNSPGSLNPEEQADNVEIYVHFGLEEGGVFAGFKEEGIQLTTGLFSHLPYPYMYVNNDNLMEWGVPGAVYNAYFPKNGDLETVNQGPVLLQAGETPSINDLFDTFEPVEDDSFLPYIYQDTAVGPFDGANIGVTGIRSELGKTEIWWVPISANGTPGAQQMIQLDSPWVDEMGEPYVSASAVYLPPFTEEEPCGALVTTGGDRSLRLIWAEKIK